MVGSGQAVVPDALLDALAAEDSRELREAASAIHGAQHDVVTRAPNEVLIVQGGPGTGRTLVGLQRVAWLLQTLSDRLDPRDVLVVGPSATYIRYLATALAGIGDPPVVQLPVSGLGPRVRVGRVDPPELRRLKGDRRLLRLVVCALRSRQRVESEPIELRVGGRVVYLDGKRVAAWARQLGSRPHNEAHRELASYLIDEVRAQLAGRAGRTGLREPTHHDVAQAVDGYLEQAWPALTPQAFLVDLLSSRRELASAAAGLLTEDEVRLLASPRDVRVGAWQWSVDDVPLLDAADALLNGLPTGFGHILVDEAQDLSPMQLESIRRRSRSGSVTLLGDLAQATGPWARSSWDDVALHLRRDRVPMGQVELEHSYRLPAEVQAVAERLLPVIAPRMRSPRAVRNVGKPVLDVPVGDPAGVADIAEEVVAVVRNLLGTGLVGIIVPGRQRARVAAALERAGVAWSPELRDASAPVVLLSAAAARGLELDSVVVVEPAQIVAEAEQGMRALYVAMTRCTSRLALVHAEPLPTELGPLQSGADEVEARRMDSGPKDRQWEADRDRNSTAPVGVADDWAYVSEVDPKAVDAWDGPAGEMDRAAETGEHVATEEPPSGGDWRLSIPREFVARTSPVRDLSAPGRIAEPPPPATADPPAHRRAEADPTAAETTTGERWEIPPPPPLPAAPPPPPPPSPAGASPDTARDPSAVGPAERWSARPAGSEMLAPRAPSSADQRHEGRAAGRDDRWSSEAAEARLGTRAPLPENGVAAGSEGRETEPGPHNGLGVSATDHDPRSNGANGVSAADHDPGDAPWNELDRDIARAVAATLAAKLTRYVNPSILPLVADELGQLVDEVTAGQADPESDEDGNPDATLPAPRHLR